MNKRGAFTLLEVIVVLGIVMILVSILSPVIAGAMHSSRMTVSKSNLRQQYIGLMLYRENNSAKLEFGSTIDMGLPIGMASSTAYLEVVPNKSVWRSPCCCHPDGPSGFPEYERYFIDYNDCFTDEGYWEPYVRKYQGDAVLLEDMHCADHQVALYAPSEPITLLGVRLNGRIEARSRTISAANTGPFWNWPSGQ